MLTRTNWRGFVDSFVGLFAQSTIVLSTPLLPFSRTWIGIPLETCRRMAIPSISDLCHADPPSPPDAMRRVKGSSDSAGPPNASTAAGTCSDPEFRCRKERRRRVRGHLCHTRVRMRVKWSWPQEFFHNSVGAGNADRRARERGRTDPALGRNKGTPKDAFQTVLTTIYTRVGSDRHVASCVVPK